MHIGILSNIFMFTVESSIISGYFEISSQQPKNDFMNTIHLLLNL